VPPERSSERLRFDPLAYWEERLEPFDLSAVGYSALGLRYNRWLYRVRSMVFRRLVSESGLDLGAAAVLDVGSGTGFYVAAWLRAGAASVTGSDATATATERLRRRFPGVRFERFDITASPPFEPESFDAVSAFDVLFHVVDDDLYRNALANLASLLRPGGLLFLSENFVHGRAVRVEHQVSRPGTQIRGLLGDLGLEVVASRPMFVLMNAPLDSQRGAHRLFWRLLSRAVSRHELVGATLGAALFPLELALVSTRRDGPSTEAVVCRKS
jgi:SAM-dependent methyltransferase